MSDDRFGYGEIGMDTSHCADATAYAMMCKPKFITNADRIRAMTDEELANSITDDWCDRVCHSPLSCDVNCETQVLAWLKQEYTP